MDDDAGDRIPTGAEFLERDSLAGLQAAELVVVAHQHALADVVAGVDGREGGGDGDADARPLLRLHRGLPRAAHPFAESRDDDLEVAVDQRVALEQPLPVDDQAGVGVAGDVLRPMAEADPGRRHGVGVDVVQQVLDGQLLHAEVHLPAELPADQIGVFGEEEDPLAGGQPDGVRRLHSSRSCRMTAL